MAAAYTPTSKYFFNPANGRTFPNTEALAKRGDMIPCNKEDGSDADLNYVNTSGEDTEKQKPKFLRNLTTGRILPYTDILAKSNSMVAHYEEEPEKEEEVEPEKESGDGITPDSGTDESDYIGSPDATEESGDTQDDQQPEEGTDTSEPEETEVIDLDTMNQKEIQTMMKEKFGLKLDLRVNKTDEDARIYAAKHIAIHLEKQDK
ncbi:MAG: hypothetical protein KAS93_07925 [Gammaproteobacteria bacterium]|nr:hypothetical protein [Gammaproteobacteria bacterium]